MEKAAEMMLQARIISRPVGMEPNSRAIINEFLFGLPFMDELKDIEQHCVKFFSVFDTLIGSSFNAGNMIKKHICKKASDELELKLNL